MGYVLLEGMFDIWTVIGWHVMQVNMYDWKICGSGGQIYYMNICCGRTCPLGGNVLWVYAEAITIELP